MPGQGKTKQAIGESIKVLAIANVVNILVIVSLSLPSFSSARN
jgi:hypothetical protein